MQSYTTTVLLDHESIVVRCFIDRELIKRREGGGDQQISPELLNKAFSTKSTQYIR
jgi:hypothetical protein